ncbi:ornithine cyclodeaminase family protein [Leekyejoonella antrihumi]|uniref:Ornithine cyclodeaminase family protein n=1 Tax=Leekyejoonella antrihumi TaxID=1660198 RepID=A0A563DZU9_9MICO|nr:ornithine cyclodeaminase family protein [Leekyejoonella antrihumi]TWP35164.1 ornithine cyclodeaminase family protein [Leekyejoonella antrihumi]
MTLILRRSDLVGLVDMAAAVNAVERAMGDLARGSAVQPGPALMRIGDDGAGFLPMAALSGNDCLASVKLLADVPANAAAGLPTQRSSIVLVSSETGEVLAMLDGAIPTRMRTAAATAVATKHLARTDSSTLGLVGAGALGVEHVAALREVLPLERVTFWTRSDQTARRFQDAVRHHGLEVKQLESPDAVVESADVVCTLTPARTPVVTGASFRPGLHVNAVGARPRPEEREIDTAGMARAGVFVDHLPTAREKSGDILIPITEGALSLDGLRGEIGAVVAGMLPGRRDRDDITLFKSVGLGIQDLAVGRLLLEQARAAGKGISVDLGS